MNESRSLPGEGARIIGAGVPITIGGEEHRLRFDFEALEIVEDELGGLLHFTTALNGGYGSKRLKAIRVGLLAGLAHEGAGRPEVATMTHTIHESLQHGFELLDAVHRAICAAFDQAIPPPSKDKRSSKGSGQGKSSRGPASSEGPSSSSTSTPESSVA